MQDGKTLMRSLEEIKVEFTRISEALGEESNLHILSDALEGCQSFDMFGVARQILGLRNLAFHALEEEDKGTYSQLAEDAGKLFEDVSNYVDAHCSCNAKSP